jgi:HicB family
VNRVTLQLPETLHRHLARQAQREGVSLQQYILYALTRQLAHSYTVHVVSEEAVVQQQDQFAALLEELGQATPAMLTAAFATRDLSIPEPELTPDVLTRLRARLTRSSPPETSGNHA